MGSAVFILAINMSVASLLATAFFLVGLYDRGQSASRWLAFAYLCGVGYYAVEAAIPFFVDATLPVVFGFALFLGATVLFNVGVSRKYGVSCPWRLMAALFVVSVAGVAAVQELPRHAFPRMMAYQAPFAVMQIIAVAIVLSGRTRRPIDTAFAVLLAASALHFILKPFLAQAVGGWGENPQAYLSSNYALFSQTAGAVFGMAVALTMLVILIRDTLLEMAARSETDALSGLLNRRGFERRADVAMMAAVDQGLPVSLVIADIDHFKSVNDTYGHAAGDNVIASFASFLATAASDHHVAGRIGGEEFAIVLPGTNLMAARLFAEGARSALAAMPVEGLPEDRRVTASFGVAELMPGEGVSSLMRRADAALYEAKNSGRDCVRLSGDTPSHRAREFRSGQRRTGPPR
ncbi:MAG TPA: GGDEF domain-containing protein [Rhizobiales bacterium]|nr:GGDEF domain-containing protein [Hyphomicrobiales bacterium]